MVRPTSTAVTDVCHGPEMPLLTELENPFLAWFYKYFAPLALNHAVIFPSAVGATSL
jgi:hypothetical protein